MTETKLEESESLLRNNVEIFGGVLGEQNPRTQDARGALAVVMFKRGAQDEGIQISREVLAAKRQALGPEHGSTMTAMENLGRLLELDGELDEAEQVFRELLSIRERMLGWNHLRTCMASDALATVLMKKGVPAGAVELLRKQLAFCTNTYGRDHRETAYVLAQLGNALCAQGNATEGELLLREACAAFDRLVPDQPGTHRTHLSHAKALHSLGRTDEAQAIAVAAFERLQATLGHDHEEVQEARGILNRICPSGPLDQPETSSLAGPAQGL